MPLRSHDRLNILSILFLLALAACSSTPLTSSSSSASRQQSASAAARPKSSAYPALPPAGSGRGGYYKDDGPGDDIPPGLENTPDAVPRIEPYLARANQPYAVFGTQYVPVTDDIPFKQQGYGSWYGKKYHGQRTSSGEIYDMYQMTAAHPTLPIPSYARVTNLSNGKQVIVRINDRGPFHPDRIIDLSFTAALKLGYIGNGSAQLQVERLLPADIERMSAGNGNGAAALAAAEPEAAPEPAPATPQAAAPVQAAPVRSEPTPVVADAAAVAAPLASGFYLQFGAYAHQANAELARARLAEGANMPAPLTVAPLNNLYRLYSGPFASHDAAAAAAAQIQASGAAKPLIVQR